MRFKTAVRKSKWRFWNGSLRICTRKALPPRAENETEIQQAISGLIKDKTVMIIAHRLRTVEDADKLVLIKDGKVAEQGTPAELKENGGIYAGMLALQKQSADWRI